MAAEPETFDAREVNTGDGDEPARGGIAAFVAAVSKRAQETLAHEFGGGEPAAGWITLAATTALGLDRRPALFEEFWPVRLVRARRRGASGRGAETADRGRNRSGPAGGGERPGPRGLTAAQPPDLFVRATPSKDATWRSTET